MRAAKRIVSTSFWEDDKIVKFSPEDKYFYLYLLTNPHTTQLGIYKFIPKIAAFEIGFSIESVMVLLDRFENDYDMIRYSEDTCEIAIKNFLVHSVLKGGKPVLDCLITEEKQVKDKTLLEYIYNNLNSKYIENLTVREYVEHLDNIFSNNENENERIVLLRNLAISCEKKPKNAKPDDLNRKDCQAEADAMFDSLWKLYPRKLGKGSVKPATKRRLYGIGFDRMKKAIDKFKADMDGRDVQYIMYGSTFFNSGYVDYLDENYDYDESSPRVDDISEPKRGISGAILE